MTTLIVWRPRTGSSLCDFAVFYTQSFYRAIRRGCSLITLHRRRAGDVISQSSTLAAPAARGRSLPRGTNWRISSCALPSSFFLTVSDAVPRMHQNRRTHWNLQSITLPASSHFGDRFSGQPYRKQPARPSPSPQSTVPLRSEEHTSELQSLRHLVCRLL